MTSSKPVFTAGNVYQGRCDEGAQGTATAPYVVAPVTTRPVADMTPQVRTRSGCLPRDGVDQAYIDMKSGWKVGESTPLRLFPTTP